LRVGVWFEGAAELKLKLRVRGDDAKELASHFLYLV
jgi:hypothetical protein